MKNEPLLIWSSVLVTLQVLAAGAALADVIGATVAALVALVVAALQAGTTFYVRGKVTPVTAGDPAGPGPTPVGRAAEKRQWQREAASE